MADDYVQQIAQLTGLTAYPNQGPFGLKEGSAIGVRDGLLLSIGPFKDGNSTGIGLLYRFAPVEDAARVKDAVKEATKGKKIEAGQDALRVVWTYSLRKPKAEDVAELAGRINEQLKAVVPPYPNKCELCESSTVSEISLMQGIPGRYCESCQWKAQEEANAAARAYESQESNFMGGLALGVPAALAGSIAWGGVAYAINRIFLWGAVLIGYLVARAVFKGMGKVTRAGQVMIGVLTVASVLFGDVIFYTLNLMKEWNAPFSWELLSLVLQNFYEIESDANGLFSVGFALFGAGYVLYTHARKPHFVVQFEKLGQPSEAKGAGAGS